VLHTDGASGLVDWASPSAEAILGYRPDELVGRRVPDLMHPDDLAHVRGYVRDAMAADQHTGHVEARFRDKDGSWRWMSDSGRAVLADDGTVLGGIDSLRDVSAEHAMREELETLARSDALTGLPNRRDLLDRLGAVLGHEPRAGTSVAVLFLDVDHLKDLNDDHGHAAGDTVLVEVGHRIRRALRSEDVVGRFAGDEFVVLLPSLASPDDAWRVADAIHQQVARPIHTGGAALRVSVSIGLTIARTGDRPEDVLHRADVALYRAKDSGRARTEADVSDAPAKADDALPAPRESFTGEASTLVHED
jgi:diguanylate cyclase (GGDEF)-like protein/PAS domain S-box-containing protein